MLARLALGFAAAVITMAAVQSSSAAGPRYSATILRSTYAASVAYSMPVSINDNGIIAGIDQTTGDSQGQRATIWDTAGTPTLLALPANATTSRAMGINNAGTAVGEYLLGSTFRGSSWSATNVQTDLPEAGAIVINNAGQILHTNSNVYTSGVPTGYGFDGTARGLSDTGIVVGSTARAGFLNPVPRRFTPNPTNYSGERGAFSSVNDSGQMVGIIGHDIIRMEADGTAVTFASSPSTEPTNSSRFATTGINDQGIFVGHLGTSPLTNPYTIEDTLSASVFRDAAAFDLSTLIDGPGTWITRRAYDINNRGQIIGYGVYDPDGSGPLAPHREAFRLDPIRSPGDTNYDNVVNFADLVVLAQNYNRSGDGQVFYETGDFNYDWTVDFADLVTLAQHYQGSAPNLDGIATGSFASDWALAQSLVPEPASAGALLIVSALARRRR